MSSTLVQPRIVPIRIPCIELATIYDEVPSLKLQTLRSQCGAPSPSKRPGGASSVNTSVSANTVQQHHSHSHNADVENQPADPTSDVFYWYTVRKYGLESMPVSLIKT